MTGGWKAQRHGVAVESQWSRQSEGSPYSWGNLVLRVLHSTLKSTI